MRVNAESAFFLANEYGTAWWANYSSGKSPLPEDLIDAVNARLSQVDKNYTADYARSIIELVNEHGANGN